MKGWYIKWYTYERVTHLMLFKRVRQDDKHSMNSWTVDYLAINAVVEVQLEPP